MASDLSALIKESLGPLPRVCQDQVLPDLERSRMTAEDFRQGNARMHRYVDVRGNNEIGTWRQMDRIRVENMTEMAQTFKNIADIVKRYETGQTDASGIALTHEDCFTQIQTEVQALGISSDDEMSDEEELEEVQCVLCHIMIGEHVLMASEGRWAGLAHDDRIVCDQCFATIQ